MDAQSGCKSYNNRHAWIRHSEFGLHLSLGTSSFVIRHPPWRHGSCSLVSVYNHFAFDGTSALGVRTGNESWEKLVASRVAAAPVWASKSMSTHAHLLSSQ